jgi:hypothetical protein
MDREYREYRGESQVRFTSLYFRSEYESLNLLAEMTFDLSGGIAWPVTEATTNPTAPFAQSVSANIEAQLQEIKFVFGCHLAYRFISYHQLRGNVVFVGVSSTRNCVFAYFI